MITFTEQDKALAEAVEEALKQASISGVPGTPAFTSPIMTAAQYEPTTFPGVAKTLPRDSNRDIGIAVAYALRTVPLVLPQFFRSTMPPPVAGAIVYVKDGAGGQPVVAFSDGVTWLRCDTRSALS